MRDARQTKIKDIKVGDVIHFIDIPYFEQDLRISFKPKTITKIELTKSGKRAYVYLDKSSDFLGNAALGLNSFLCDPDKKFWERIEKERGWK